jgi:hypothetical protein
MPAAGLHAGDFRKVVQLKILSTIAPRPFLKLDLGHHFTTDLGLVRANGNLAA